MCVQYMIEADLDSLMRRYRAHAPELFSWKPRVFPRYITPAIISTPAGLEIRPFHFGLIPFFEKNQKPEKVFHNARVETVGDKPSFKKAFAERRAIIPIQSFFEYVIDGAHEKRLAQFFPIDDEMLNAAAIFNPWRAPDGTIVESIAIITRAATVVAADGTHERSPLFLPTASLERWCSGSLDEARQIIRTSQHPRLRGQSVG